MTFEPKVETSAFLDRVEIDLRRHNVSGTAVNQHVDDENTEVYFGKIHAQVKFFDLGLIVVMDPFEGNWKDAKWARKAAFDALKKDLTPKAFGSIVDAIFERGCTSGAKAAQAKIQQALGIKESRYL